MRFGQSNLSYRRIFVANRRRIAPIPARGGDVLEEHEFAWAWSMVRSRAITFEVKKASTGRIERKRCLVPVCDVFNHSPTSL